MAEPVDSVQLEIPEGFIDVSRNKDAGVLKKIIKPGLEGENPKKGNEVTVHYVGTLYDGEKAGEKFDSSRDRGDYFKFKLGTGSVIKAWDDCVQTMCLNEICEVICKPDYAYGKSGSPPKIPPSSTLKFEIELFGWQGEDITDSKDGGIIKDIIKEGTGYDHPEKGTQVTISFSGYNKNDPDKKIVHSSKDGPVTLYLGPSSDVVLCPGMIFAIEKMKKGEISEFELTPKYAFGKEGNSSLGIAPDSKMKYKIELIDFDKFKESYDFNTNEERLAESESLKTKGNDYFKKSHFSMAEIFYKKVISYLEDEPMKNNETDSSKRDSLLLSTYINMAICLTKDGNDIESINYCDKALSIDANSEKALFRKAQANMNLQNFEIAQQIFDHVLQVNKDNQAASQLSILCHKKIKESLEKEKNMCRNIFSKMFIQSETNKMDIESKAESEAVPVGDNN